MILLFCSYSAYALSLSDAQKEYLYGDYQAAIRKAKALRENDAVLYFLGLSCLKAGKYYRARIYLRRLLRLFPASALAEQGRVKIADTYFLANNLSKAKSFYREIEAEYPAGNFLPVVYLRLAQIAAKEGDWQAKKKYLEALKAKYADASIMKYVRQIERYGDFFTVQVGAFARKENARLLKNELESRGYRVYLAEEKKEGRFLYKVRTGKFKKRSEAEKIYRRLLDQGYPARIYP